MCIYESIEKWKYYYQGYEQGEGLCLSCDCSLKYSLHDVWLAVLYEKLKWQH